MSEENDDYLDSQGGSHDLQDQCQPKTGPDEPQPSTSRQDAGQLFPAPGPAALPEVEDAEVEPFLPEFPNFDNGQDYLNFLYTVRDLASVNFDDLAAKGESFKLKLDLFKNRLSAIEESPEAEVQTSASSDEEGSSTSTSIPMGDKEEMDVTGATHEAGPQPSDSASSHVGMVPHVEDKGESSGSATTKTEQKPTAAASSSTTSSSRKRSVASETEATNAKKKRDDS